MPTEREIRALGRWLQHRLEALAWWLLARFHPEHAITVTVADEHSTATITMAPVAAAEPVRSESNLSALGLTERQQAIFGVITDQPQSIEDIARELHKSPRTLEQPLRELLDHTPHLIHKNSKGRYTRA